MKLEIFSWVDFSFPLDSAEAADQANEKLNAWLKENGKVIHGNYDGTWFWAPNKATHKALLICIEPIEKCTHKPEDVRQMNWSAPVDGFNRGLDVTNQVVFKCIKCNAQVLPKEFEEVK